MAKETLTTRLEPDTKSAVERYAEDRDISQTVAARRLIRSGLAAEGEGVAATDGGAMVDRLDKLQEQQDATTLRQKLAYLLGVPYIAAHFAFDLGGLPWATFGALIVLGIVFGPQLRDRFDQRGETA